MCSVVKPRAEKAACSFMTVACSCIFKEIPPQVPYFVTSQVQLTDEALNLKPTKLRQKPAPVPLHPQQILYDITQDRPWVSSW
jgi:hypothetical protein